MLNSIFLRLECVSHFDGFPNLNYMKLVACFYETIHSNKSVSVQPMTTRHVFTLCGRQFFLYLLILYRSWFPFSPMEIHEFDHKSNIILLKFTVDRKG